MRRPPVMNEFSVIPKVAAVAGGGSTPTQSGVIVDNVMRRTLARLMTCPATPAMLNPSNFFKSAASGNHRHV